MRHTRTVWGSVPTNPLHLTKERIQQLQQLCHPDKHTASPLSVKVSQWLVECRKELDKSDRLNA